jgi:hypothetical protein
VTCIERRIAQNICRLLHLFLAAGGGLCTVTESAAGFANFVALEPTLNVNENRGLLAAHQAVRAPQFIPDFAIHGSKNTKFHNGRLLASKPLL